MCNYGAPDSDLAANYSFYRVNHRRSSQNVPLQPFPPGRYELEVHVRDRLTRADSKAVVAFTVASGLR